MVNNQETVHTFTKGMNQDVDTSLRTPDMYYSARNLRLSNSNKPGSSQSLQNDVGNEIANTEESFPSGYLICGSVVIRDILILFLTDSESATPSGNSIIYKCKISNYTGELTDFYKIYDDSAVTADGSTLDLSTVYPITGIGRYETSDIINIYFVDGYNNFRHFNAADYLTENGGTYNPTTNKYIPANLFDAVTDCDFTKPIVDEIISGDLTSGSISYAYQFFTDGGAKSNVSPFTNPISITSSSFNSSTDFKVKGNDQDVNCGKGYKLKIDNTNDYFSRIKLIAVHFNQFGGTPIVRVANEKYIAKGETEIYITDTGETLEELTLSEVTLDNSSIFSAHAIESKDDKLFLGNIEYDVFDIDYDARAYRFANSTVYQSNTDIRGRSRIYNAEGWYYQSSVGDGDNTWTLYNDSDVSQGTIASWDDIPTTFDCINPYNDLDNDSDTDYRFLYQENGTTPGGSGPNISYKFDLEAIQIHRDNSTNKIQTNLSNDTDNVSYEGYSSESIQEKYKGFAREEVYRVGITFQNTKGVSSYVKWIGDIRMPSMNDITDQSFTLAPTVTGVNDFQIIKTSSSGSVTYASVLGINFTVTIPAGVESYQIVRVKREVSDRSVLSQGLIQPTEQDSSSGTNTDVPTPYGTALLGNTNNIRFFSPEISFNRNLNFRSNDYLQVYAKYPRTYDTDYERKYNMPISAAGTFDSYVVKKIDNLAVTVVSDGIDIVQKHTITDAAILAQGSDEILVNTRSCRNYNDDGGSSSSYYGGTALYFDGPASTTTSWLPVNTAGSLEGLAFNYLASYKRNVYDSQYGGNTYEDRSANVYIAASDMYPTSTTTFSTFQGDIFINYHSCAVNIFDLTKHDDTIHQTVHFPVETTINTSLQHGFNHGTVDPASDNLQLVQEVAGDWVDDDGYTLNQPEDMYVYNTAYSQDNTIKSFVPKPIIYTEEYKYDTRVINSNTKINGEIVDSWLKFDTNDFIDVDSRYFKINNLLKFNNKLYFWQDKAFGVLSVNQRSLISDGQIGGLQLGTGGVLDRFDYISDRVGNMNKHGIGKSMLGLYWVDNNTNEIYSYSDSLKPLSTVKGMKTYIETFGEIGDVKIGVDDKNKEVLITIYPKYSSFGDGDTLVFDETNYCFSYFCDILPDLYIETKDSLLSVKSSTTNIYSHSLIEGNGILYGTQYDSTLSILHNDKYLNTKVYDNLKWFTTSINSSGNNVFTDTWDEVRVYNDYQNSDWRTLVYKSSSIVDDEDHPYDRREREFSCAIPRNAVNKSVATNPDIMLAANLDVTQTFKERIRDKYAMIEFTYDNTNDLSANYVIVKYRISYR